MFERERVVSKRVVPVDFNQCKRIFMFPPFWGLAQSGMLPQMQREMERLAERFDAAFRAMLALDERIAGKTPADVVYAEHTARLLHYRPMVAQPQPVPLLIVPSLLTRYYALDLMPGQSLVEYLVRQGLDVYLLDWGTPDVASRFITFDQYITGYVRRAVQHVQQRSGQTQISILGYSLGGTFASIYSALFPEDMRNLVVLAAPINFHDHGVLSQWLRKDRYNVDLVVDTLGAMPPALMQASFRLLKPTLQIMQQLTLANTAGDLDVVQDYLAMQSWLADTTPWLGEAYRTYIKECYQHNHLISQQLVVGGRRVDLHNIAAALLTVVATKDQLCPPASTTVLNDAVSSTDKQVVTLNGSHVSIIVGRHAAQQWPQFVDGIVARSSRAGAT